MISTEQLRKKVLQITLEAIKVVSSVGLNTYVNDLCAIAEEIVCNKIKILICGSFISGKSTFVNALLGKEISPVSALPTPVITVFSYGETIAAKINFRNPLPKKIFEGINDSIMSHMAVHGPRDIPPIDIDYEKIGEFVLEPIIQNRINSLMELENPFEFVDIHYPASILEEGIILVDTFGINEAYHDNIKTLAHLQKADSVIFLLSSCYACSVNEMDFIENVLVPLGFDDILFVVNKFDLVHQKDRHMVKNFINSKVANFTKSEVLYVSSLFALEGKSGSSNGENISEEEREILLEKSGFIHFEEVLRKYVVDQQRKRIIGQIRKLNSLIKNKLLFVGLSELFNQTEDIDNSYIVTFKENIYSISHRLDDIMFDYVERG